MLCQTINEFLYFGFLFYLNKTNASNLKRLVQIYQIKDTRMLQNTKHEMIRTV